MIMDGSKEFVEGNFKEKLKADSFHRIVMQLQNRKDDLMCGPQYHSCSRWLAHQMKIDPKGALYYVLTFMNE